MLMFVFVTLQASGEVRVTRKFLENFSGDQVTCWVYHMRMLGHDVFSQLQLRTWLHS